MPNTLLKTKYLLATDDDWPVAEFYREEEAEGIAYEHNQYATLIEQRDQLVTVLRELLNRLYPHTCDRGPACNKCKALLAGSKLLATIEREGETSR